MGPITVTLPFASPSLNELLRWHWSKRRKYHDQVCLLLRMQVQMHRYEPANKRMHMELLRVGKRTIDADNLVGGAKPIVDALVKATLLVDDSPKWLEGTYSQLTDRRNQYTQIILYPWEGIDRG